MASKYDLAFHSECTLSTSLQATPYSRKKEWGEKGHETLAWGSTRTWTPWRSRAACPPRDTASFFETPWRQGLSLSSSSVHIALIEVTIHLEWVTYSGLER